MGAGYNSGDIDVWGRLDPYFIGINGQDDTISPIPHFDWNASLLWMGDIFKRSNAPCKDKKFDAIYIAKNTLGPKMQVHSFAMMMRLVTKWNMAPYVFIPRDVTTSKYTEIVNYIQMHMVESGNGNDLKEELEFIKYDVRQGTQ